MKDPKTCNESAWMGDIPICRLDLLPCYAIAGCVKDGLDEFVDFCLRLAGEGEKKDDDRLHKDRRPG